MKSLGLAKELDGMLVSDDSCTQNVTSRSDGYVGKVGAYHEIVVGTLVSPTASP